MSNFSELNSKYMEDILTFAIYLDFFLETKYSGLIHYLLPVTCSL